MKAAQLTPTSEQHVNLAAHCLPALATEKEVNLAESRLPACLATELVWQEFHLKKGKETKVWSIAIEPGGEGFRVREGKAGQALRESKSIVPKRCSNPSLPTYVSAKEACRQEVQRRIQLRLTRGYRELVNGKLQKSTKLEIDFDAPLPKSIQTPKPKESIPEGEFARLHKEKLTRITRKYDGIGLIVARHTYGWEIYSLHGNRITSRFPKHVAALEETNLKPGTVLKAEGIVFDPNNPLHENFSAANKTFTPGRRSERIRQQIESGELCEPSIVFYDTLYANGKDLADVPYDERTKYWKDLPVARMGNGLLLSAEYYPQVTPKNWREMRKKLGYEGFVVVDGSATLGKKSISFSSSAPRPKGSYKLKPNMQEDVVIYAVRKVGDVYESVFTKQRYPDCFPDTETPHPKAGEWFYCGRVSLHNMKEVVNNVDHLVNKGLIEVVSNNKEGESIAVDNDNGVTAVIEFFDRYASNKFRHGKFAQPVRFRNSDGDYKAPAECTAHYLGKK